MHNNNENDKIHLNGCKYSKYLMLNQNQGL
jgi:hypothetical protein